MIRTNAFKQEDIPQIISQLLDWYNEHGSNTSIQNLLDFQDRLSILSVNLAEMTGEAKGSYIRAYFNRKINHSIKKMAFIEGGSSAAKAETKALTQIGELSEIELRAEQVSYCLALELKQINKVLSAVQQRISFAKTEKSRLQNQPHDNTK